MKMRCAVLIALLLVNSALGTDAIEYLKKDSWMSIASVSATGLTVRLQGCNVLVAPNGVPEPWRHMEEGETLALVADQEVWLGCRYLKVVFRPVAFKDKQKGFRVAKMLAGDSAHPCSPSHITFVALGDAPAGMGEGDVEMVMDNGEWVSPEKSKSWEIEKLGWYAEKIVEDAETIMQDAEMMARVSRDPSFAKLWATLIEKGLIKPKAEIPLVTGSKDAAPQETPPNPDEPPPPQAEPQAAAAGDAQPETQPQPRTLWPYALIPLAFLVALWVVRKKRKQGG
ncbi:MAG: hypothetical protein FWG50_09840 [Kiritimatiellaeota bacterium]|nr:hypothetical protein [Kiritimatiellota bacterium]